MEARSHPKHGFPQLRTSLVVVGVRRLVEHAER
jgi:hypothetical protein